MGDQKEDGGRRGEQRPTVRAFPPFLPGLPPGRQKAREEPGRADRGEEQQVVDRSRQEEGQQGEQRCQSCEAEHRIVPEPGQEGEGDQQCHDLGRQRDAPESEERANLRRNRGDQPLEQSGKAFRQGPKESNRLVDRIDVPDIRPGTEAGHGIEGGVRPHQKEEWRRHPQPGFPVLPGQRRFVGDHPGKDPDRDLRREQSQDGEEKRGDQGSTGAGAPILDVAPRRRHYEQRRDEGMAGRQPDGAPGMGFVDGEEEPSQQDDPGGLAGKLLVEAEDRPEQEQPDGQGGDPPAPDVQAVQPVVEKMEKRGKRTKEIDPKIRRSPPRQPTALDRIARERALALTGPGPQREGALRRLRIAQHGELEVVVQDETDAQSRQDEQGARHENDRQDRSRETWAGHPMGRTSQARPALLRTSCA